MSLKPQIQLLPELTTAVKKTLDIETLDTRNPIPRHNCHEISGLWSSYRATNGRDSLYKTVINNFCPFPKVKL